MLPWYLELPLSDRQRLFLKKLLGLSPVYKTIREVEEDFIRVFAP
jgi:serine/threonine-protein kinase